VFTRMSLKNLLSVNGFEILKDDSRLYGYTVLCRKVRPTNKINNDGLNIKEILEKQKKAIELIHQKQPEKAVEIYPMFPDGWIAYALNKENMKDFGKQKEVLEVGLSHNPDSFKLKRQLAIMFYQWDENTPEKQYYSNNIKKAEGILLDLLNEKPGSEDILHMIGMINGKYKKDYNKAVYYFKEELKTNPTKFSEVWNNIGYFWKEKEKNENRP